MPERLLVNGSNDISTNFVSRKAQNNETLLGGRLADRTSGNTMWNEKKKCTYDRLDILTNLILRQYCFHTSYLLILVGSIGKELKGILTRLISVMRGGQNYKSRVRLSRYYFKFVYDWISCDGNLLTLPRILKQIYKYDIQMYGAVVSRIYFFWRIIDY